MFPRILTILFVLICNATTSSAEERFALVIANDAYDNIEKLENSTQDGAIISAKLEELGFDVTFIENANLADMKRSIGRYGIRVQEAENGSVGIVYFVGHGVNAFDDNFLLPIDVNIEDAEDLDFVAIDVDTLSFSRDVENDVKNLIILDCCTASPLAGVPGMGGNGLFPKSVPNGNFIAYSTPANGTVPSRGDAGNTFVTSFIAEISAAGQSFEETIVNVNAAVVAEAGDAQTIFWSSSLNGSLVLVAEPELSDEEKAWLMAQDNLESSALITFLGQFPNGEFTDAAKRLLLLELTAELTPAGEEATEAEAEAAPVVENVPEAIETVAEPVEQSLPDALVGPEFVSFREPLTHGSTDVLGKTVEELIKGNALFSPIDDLPDAVWKGKECKDCHQWTIENLCTQAQFYVGASGEESVRKQHPYGGTFKENLLVWAQGGCQP